LFRMTATRTLSALLVWLRASERISVRVLGIWNHAPQASLAAHRGNRVAHRTSMPDNTPMRLQIGPDARGRPTSISDETKWQTKALSIAA
jgi:hypothetical protein